MLIKEIDNHMILNESSMILFDDNVQGRTIP